MFFSQETSNITDGFTIKLTFEYSYNLGDFHPDIFMEAIPIKKCDTLLYFIKTLYSFKLLDFYKWGLKGA